jgi:hypothetical protein
MDVKKRRRKAAAPMKDRQRGENASISILGQRQIDALSGDLQRISEQ